MGRKYKWNILYKEKPNNHIKNHHKNKCSSTDMNFKRERKKRTLIGEEKKM